MRVAYPTSAGGVVYRKREGEIEVVLCGHHNPKSWRLPKGTPDPGEGWEETAVREVAEETGLQVAIEEPLDSIQYWFSADGVRNHKTVHFYLMRPVGGSTKDHDREFDEVRWFKAKDIDKTLTYSTETTVVHQALEIVGRRHGGGSDAAQGKKVSDS
jgi:8-oxo-dGTP pyrophosphatase MutT (NUDIX family)